MAGKKSILIDPRQPEKQWVIEIQKDGRVTKMVEIDRYEPEDAE